MKSKIFNERPHSWEVRLKLTHIFLNFFILGVPRCMIYPHVRDEMRKPIYSQHGYLMLVLSTTLECILLVRCYCTKPKTRMNLRTKCAPFSAETAASVQPLYLYDQPSKYDNFICTRIVSFDYRA